MARVVTRCPNMGRLVPTGFHLTEAKLEQQQAQYSFRCSACGLIHQWTRKDAWVEGTPAR